MGLTLTEVLGILRILDESACQELDLQWGDLKLAVRRKGSGAGPGAAVPPAASAGAAAGAPAAAEVAAARAPAAPVAVANGVQAAPVAAIDGAPAAPGAAAAGASGRLVAVRAPSVGTFYRAPAPTAPPFVEVGSTVRTGETVCIVEVMKVMNMVKSPCCGRVVEIRASNAEMVEYGQVLLQIEPQPEPAIPAGGMPA